MLYTITDEIVCGVKKRKNAFIKKRLSSVINGLSRRSKQCIALMTDMSFVLITVWLSFSLRYDTFHIAKGGEWTAYIVAIIIALPIFVYSGFYRSIFRYSGFAALSAIIRACILYGVLYCISAIVIIPYDIPRSIGILQPLLLILAVASSRAMARYLFHPGNAKLYSKDDNKERLLIYGAGFAGAQIASALLYNANYCVNGFIDDDATMYGKCINGITVYSPEDVKTLVEKRNISSILIAIPSASRSRRYEIIRSLEGLGVHIRTLPGIEALANGKVSISDICEVDIEDLLGRYPVPPDKTLFSKCIEGKTVLVTGAGGSIGSELSRQILFQNPDNLILLDHSEYNLYCVQRELLERNEFNGNKVRIEAILGDVTDCRYMMDICTRHQPDTVYHAAAYKHVPLVEENALQGLRNNVLGTLSIAEAAKKCKAKHVILVSTDKAVRPTNIMGASKRISELILQAMSGEQNSDTCFSMVRFGNVLGSSGSVVPLFRTQIRDGGPVTVTHKEVTRYFMTITEAAQLVIQAGAIAQGGDVFLLDMGKPVKIIDLARRMINLSGLTVKDKENPDGDIEIVVIGLRPGEKLYEELLIADNPIPTIHPRIFKAHESFINMSKLREHLNTLQMMILERNCDEKALKDLIKKIVNGYQINSIASEQEEISVISNSVHVL